MLQCSSIPHFANISTIIYLPLFTFHFSQLSHSRFPSFCTSGCYAKAMAAAASAANAPTQQAMVIFGGFAFSTTGAVKLENKYDLNYFNEHQHPG